MMIGQRIEKENIPNLKIVPAHEDRSSALFGKLLEAQRLGNEFKSKTVIAFMTADGPKCVETTVWSTTDGYIHLKGGVLIPLNSIIEIDF